MRDLFPEDTTMLVTREASPHEGQGEDASPATGEGGVATGGMVEEGAGGAGSGVPLVDLKSFTTQAFFTCWRAVHLGLLQVGIYRQEAGMLCKCFVHRLVSLLGFVDRVGAW